LGRVGLRDRRVAVRGFGGIGTRHAESAAEAVFESHDVGLGLRLGEDLSHLDLCRSRACVQPFGCFLLLSLRLPGVVLRRSRSFKLRSDPA
jgi:hypothetical protein